MLHLKPAAEFVELKQEFVTIIKCFITVTNIKGNLNQTAARFDEFVSFNQCNDCLVFTLVNLLISLSFHSLVHR